MTLSWTALEPGGEAGGGGVPERRESTMKERMRSFSSAAESSPASQRSAKPRSFSRRSDWGAPISAAKADAPPTPIAKSPAAMSRLTPRC